MRRIVLVIFVLLSVISFHAQAQTAITVGGFSTYVVDNGDRPYDKPLAYGSVTQNLPSGFYVGLWGSTGTEGGRELDYLVGWANKNFSVCTGYYAHAGGSPANLIQIDLRGTYPLKKGNHVLEFYLMGSPILPTNSDGDSGALIRVGVNDKWKIFDNTELTQGAWLMYDSGVYKGERGLTIRYETGIRLKYNSVFFTPIIRLSAPINMTERKTHVIAGIQIGL